MLNRRNFIRYSVATTGVTSLSSCAAPRHTITIDDRLPVGPFNADSTAEDVTNGIDLTGKVALVTGCTSGIGFETMRVLALRGAHVIGTGRTLEKAQSACAKIKGTTTAVALELSDLHSVVACANSVKDLNEPIDMLILNAGVGSYTKFGLINGIESIFHINYLGHFVLANHLLPLVESAEQGRIVHVGSRMGYMSVPDVGIDFDNLKGEKDYDSELAYGRSKLANALFSLELSKQLKSTRTTSNVIHPGFVKTNIARSAPAFMRIAFDMFGSVIAKTPAQGAATQSYVATSALLSTVSGAYFEDCNPVKIEGENYVFDEAMARKLWLLSEEMSEGFLI